MKLHITKFLALLQVVIMLGSPFLVYAEESVTPPAQAQSLSENKTQVTVDTETKTNDSVDEEDDTDIDLGNDQAEQDSKKDFTGVVRQSKDYTCGPASLATLMTQLGNDTNESEVLDLITSENLNSEKGTNLLALKIASQKLGNTTWLKKWTASEILAYIKSSSDPVLIHDEKKEVGGHFSVIREYDPEKGIVELSDTEAGNIKYSVKDFEHIYTGEALIINDMDPGGTNITDEEAKLIWGKYVPVQVLAANSTNRALSDAAKVFATCTTTALTKSTVSLRNTARKLCYDALAQAIAKNLNNSGEAGFALDYNAASFADGALKLTGLTKGAEKKDIGSQLGEDTIVKILQQKLDANKALLAGYTKAITDAQATIKNANQTDYNKKVSLSGQITTKQSALSTSNTQASVLSSSPVTKQTSATNLTSQINNGNFVKDGQTYSLGAVGNQVTAQSATYSKLSSALSGKLANIDSQIASIQRQISSANSNVTTYNNQASNYRASASSAYSSYQYYNGKRGYTSTANSYYNQYVNYTNQANQASSNAQYYQNQINSYNSQITTLQQQKSSANTEVSNANAELARAQTLKKFGDAEMQRLKTLLVTLNSEIKTLQTQLDTARSNVTKYTSELAILNTDYAKVSYATPALSSTELSKQNLIISSNQTLYTSLNAETQAQQSEIANEASFEKGMSDQTETVGTPELDGTRNFISGFGGGTYDATKGMTVFFGGVMIDGIQIWNPSANERNAIRSSQFIAGTFYLVKDSINGFTMITNDPYDALTLLTENPNRTGYEIGKIIPSLIISKLVARQFKTATNRTASVTDTLKSLALTEVVQYVKVGRWMSMAEYNLMKSTGKIQIGAGGVTDVAVGGPTSYSSATAGSIYVEFEVPSKSILQGGSQSWRILVSSTASNSLITTVIKNGGMLIENLNFKNLSGILQTK